MKVRYLGKIASIINDYTVVINKGAEHGVSVGQNFMIVKLGDTIVDPETNQDLEPLEIVRGHVIVTHVQRKIATLESCDYLKDDDTREIKKLSSHAGLFLPTLGSRETIAETIIPGKRHVKALEGVEIGDFIVKL